MLLPAKKSFSIFDYPSIPWIIQIGTLVFTLFSLSFTFMFIETRAREQFENDAFAVVETIEARLQVYESLLRGGAGLFASSKSVERDEWKKYVESIHMNAYWPGIQGVGYAAFINSVQKKSFVLSVREEGFPQFSIFPESDRAESSTIVYIEPFDERNQRAFGFDMLTEKVRREAMESARAEEGVVFSGKVRLLQEADNESQAGFLMYLWSKKNSSGQEGWVYAPFRMNDLMNGLHLSLRKNVRFQIFDVADGKNQELMYSSSAISDTAPKGAVHSKVIAMQVGGRDWRAVFFAQNLFFSSDFVKHFLFLIIGSVLINVLLFYVLYALKTVRRKAVALADEMTAEIQHKTRSLDESEKRFKLATQTAKIGIWEWTISSNALVWDDQMYEMYGIKASDFTGAYDAWERGLAPEDKILAVSDLQKAVRGEKDFATEFKIIWPDQSVHFIKAYGIVIRDDSGAPVKMIGANWDITEPRKMDEELRKTLEALKEKNEELSDFAHVVSHDLKAPTYAVSSLVEWLSSDYGKLLDDKGRQQIELIQKKVQEMRSLINGILEYSTAGKLEENKTQVSILTLLQEIFQTINIPSSVHVEVSNNLPEVFCEKTRIRQVFQNLIDNAIKYRDKPQTHIKISVCDKGFYWEFRVTDNGPGIAKRNHEKIFQLFGAFAGKPRYESSGIGLAIVRKSVEHHGGRVWVESEPGAGADFIFTLPKYSAA